MCAPDDGGGDARSADNFISLYYMIVLLLIYTHMLI